MNDLFFAVSAFALGALHALEPGHGKTVVAAYLVGSHGRVRDAVALGGVVTFTHTFSIIVLGVLTAVATTYLVPETVHEALEVVSGLLVLAVGIWMLDARIVRPHRAQRQAVEQAHRPAADDHEHGPHTHRHRHAGPAGGQRLDLWGLVTLGISGGIVPCPGALALLLAAAAVGDVVAGVSLVIVFSLGLASVLVAIGIALVRAADLALRRFGERFSDGRLAWRASAGSAVVVTLLGVFMTSRAALHIVAGLGPLG